VSEVLSGGKTFLALFSQGGTTDIHADDFVEAWHNSGDEEQRSLAEYLGMTDEEYGVWVITPRAMPSIVEARRSGRPLRETIAPFFERLRAANDPKDAPALHALSYWLGRDGNW
jgi:hypothetical protein